MTGHFTMNLETAKQEDANRYADYIAAMLLATNYRVGNEQHTHAHRAINGLIASVVPCGPGRHALVRVISHLLAGYQAAMDVAGEHHATEFRAARAQEAGVLLETLELIRRLENGEEPA